LNPEYPIGIFDSGIGGLTVARAVRNALPDERIIYFGDTEHLPYGDKSTAAIQAFSIKICDFLLKSNCKVILIACNSASVAAYDLIREYVASKAIVLNVIDPMVGFAESHLKSKRIGLIGTRRTIESGVYDMKIAERMDGLKLQALATPLLVPMIEEGFVFNNISHDIISNYLSEPALQNIDALLLACTHYPLIEEEIKDYYKGEVKVVNSADLVASRLRNMLEEKGLLSSEKSGKDHFYVSDFTESFEKSTKLFFGESIHLEKYQLWS
jgi:glutamate racemase